MKTLKLEDIDKNFAANTDFDSSDLSWININQKPFEINGVYHNEKQYIRMPEEFAANVSEGVSLFNYRTAGGRVRFKTNSKKIAIKVVTENFPPMLHMPRSGQSCFDLYIKKDGKYVFENIFLSNDVNMTNGYSSIINLNGNLEEYLINFPLYDQVFDVYLGFEKSAEIIEPCEYTYKKPIVFYGSSITQGGCASRPGSCYTSLISTDLDSDYINLGFAGRCKGEKEMAEYISNLDMSLFVYDYDHNAYSLEMLKDTHYPFYEIIRKKNPNLPIIFVTAPYYKNKLRNDCKELIFDNYQTALKSGDKNVGFVDGSALFNGEF